MLVCHCLLAVVCYSSSMFVFRSLVVSCFCCLLCLAIINRSRGLYQSGDDGHSRFCVHASCLFVSGVLLLCYRRFVCHVDCFLCFMSHDCFVELLVLLSLISYRCCCCCCFCCLFTRLFVYIFFMLVVAASFCLLACLLVCLFLCFFVSLVVPRLFIFSWLWFVAYSFICYMLCS